MFTAFRFGIPAVYGDVGGPQIRAPHNPAPVVAANNPPAAEVDENPPIHVPLNQQVVHEHVEHNDGGNVRNV